MEKLTRAQRKNTPEEKVPELVFQAIPLRYELIDGDGDSDGDDYAHVATICHRFHPLVRERKVPCEREKRRLCYVDQSIVVGFFWCDSSIRF